MSYVEIESRRRVWLIIFFCVSLFLHLVFLLIIVLLHLFFPGIALAKIVTPPTALRLLAQDPSVRSHPPAAQKRRDFIPTDANPSIKNPNAPLVSDNDSVVRSLEAARATDSPLPDLEGIKNRPLELKNETESASTKPTDQSTPPQLQKEQPKPQTAPQVAKTRPPDKMPPKPMQNPQPISKPIPPKPVVQQFTPEGLPVLPPLSADTLAPPLPPGENQPEPKVLKTNPNQPPPSFAVDRSDNLGGNSELGATSADASATELGRYKAKVYRTVGARWHNKLRSSLVLQTLPIGSVHIQYTIHSDGHVEITVLEGGDDPSLEILKSISVDSIKEPDPYDVFSDALKKEVGDSFTDDFTFTIYGG